MNDIESSPHEILLCENARKLESLPSEEQSTNSWNRYEGTILLKTLFARGSTRHILLRPMESVNEYTVCKILGVNRSCDSIVPFHE